MDMRRFMPILLIAFAALFILPQLFRKSSSSTLSSKDRAAVTLAALERIDRAEVKALGADGSYTGNLADLVTADVKLVSELTVPLKVDLDVAANGKSYVVRVSSDVIAYARARNATKVTARSCRVIKSSGGVKCPVIAPKPKA
jgi:hypothetical protein